MGEFARRGAPVDLLVYEHALWHKDIAGSIVFTCPEGVWPVDPGTRNLNRIPNRKDRAKLMQGVELLHEFRHHTDAGRPFGSDHFEGADGLARLLHPIVSHLRQGGKQPTQELVAEHLGRDTRTLQRWIQDYFHCGWRDVRAWSADEWRRRMRR